MNKPRAARRILPAAEVDDMDWPFCVLRILAGGPEEVLLSRSTPAHLRYLPLASLDGFGKRGN